MSQRTLYGIPNCDSVKKARRWLDEQGHDYAFHNYKKDGVPAERLAQWAESLGLEQLVNRRGATWRQLDEAQKATVEQGGAAALALLAEHASMIKRPLLEHGGAPLLGFDAEHWAEAL